VHDFWLYQTLANPIVQPSPRQDGTYLVDFRVHEPKIGYVVVCKVEEAVVVKTFLLMTMDDTLEGIELKKRF
jgi:hypothetical protein